MIHLIQQGPGIHLRELQRKSQVPLSNLRYHLLKLEEKGVVSSILESNRRCYYISRDFPLQEEQKIIAVLKRENHRHVVNYILAHPGCHHKDLQKQIPVAPATLSFYIAQLIKARVIQRDRVGRFSFYYLEKPDLVRKVMAEIAPSWLERFIDRALETYSDLPYGEKMDLKGEKGEK